MHSEASIGEKIVVASIASMREVIPAPNCMLRRIKLFFWDILTSSSIELQFMFIYRANCQISFTEITPITRENWRKQKKRNIKLASLFPCRRRSFFKNSTLVINRTIDRLTHSKQSFFNDPREPNFSSVYYKIFTKDRYPMETHFEDFIRNQWISLNPLIFISYVIDISS